MTVAHQNRWSSTLTPQQRTGLFSSSRGDWATPRQLFQNLDDEFGFQLDACATAETALCPTAYFEDSLSLPWMNPTFCNPPYGRRIGVWVEKAYRESMLGNTCVLYFDDNRQKRAPFPSAIVVFRSVLVQEAA
jgi:hypothetical protein